MSETWRVGRKLGRTLYINDVVVGMVDTPEQAARIVEAMNRASADVRVRDVADILAARIDQLELDLGLLRMRFRDGRGA